MTTRNSRSPHTDRIPRKRRRDDGARPGTRLGTSQGGSSVTAADRVRQLAAALLTAAAVVLLPALLVVLVGWPLPTSVPTSAQVVDWVSDPLSSAAVVDVLAVVFWVMWAHFVACVVVEVINATARRGRPALHVPGGGVSQEWARRLVAAVLLVGATAPLAAVAGPIGADPVDRVAQTQVTAAHKETREPAASTGVPTTPAANSAANTAAATPAGVGGAVAAVQDDELRRYVVVAPRAGYGDTLWDIAERHLGDGLRWSQIHALNAGQIQPDGDALEDPDLIRPGWQLRMPPDATDLPLWTHPATAQTPATSTPADGEPPPLPAEAAASASQAPSAGPSHLVEPGETLWQITEDRLGDGARYDELASAADDLVQPDGQQLADPDLIRPGWTIPLPVAAHPATAAPDATAGQELAAATSPVDRADGDSATPSPVASAPASPRTVESPDASAGAGATGRAAEVHDAEVYDDGLEDEAGEVEPPWMLLGLTGAGAVLAAALLLTLRRRRRAQFRARRPGRTIAPVPAELAAVERSIAVSGGRAAPTVQTLDWLLRQLARDLSGERPTGDGAPALPALAAVELTGSDVVLHLGAPMTLPGGWHGTDDDLHWTHRASDPADLADAEHDAEAEHDVHAEHDDAGGMAADRWEQPAPYPLLVTVGADSDGDVWLLNLEHLGTVSITGDPGAGRDFARHLVAELALQDWSRGLLVDCIGLAGELVPLNPEVLRYHPATPAHAAVGALVEAAADAVALADRVEAHLVDPASGRGAQVGDDMWPARLVLADLDCEPAPGGGSLVDLVDLVQARPGRTGTSVLLTGGPDGPVAGVQIDIDARGRLRMPASGLDVTAVGLPEDEAAGCARVAAAADDLDGAPMPLDADLASEDGHEDRDQDGVRARGEDGHGSDWHRFADAAGALRPDLTLPRHHDRHDGHDGNDGHDGHDGHDVDRRVDDLGALDDPVAAASLLEGEDEEYLACSATTAEDLQALAPRVSAEVRQAVEDADPTLDADLASWWSEDCALPRLTLLGPVRARTRGAPLAKRRPYYTDLLAYLWSRPHGATPAEVAEAFGLTVARVRTDIKVLRDWLGTNPRTGRRHLPDATQSAAAADRGVGVYQVDGLLVDADLFRRLRVRGQARGGEAGLADLRAALELVTGRPCDQLRPGGWSWMLEGNRLDEHLLCAVVDLAHTVTTRCLRDGDLDGARAAAELSVASAPEEEIPRLDMAAVARAEGDARAARRIALDEVCNRSDDGQAPTELSDRTRQILARHDWLHADTAAG